MGSCIRACVCVRVRGCAYVLVRCSFSACRRLSAVSYALLQGVCLRGDILRAVCSFCVSSRLRLLGGDPDRTSAELLAVLTRLQTIPRPTRGLFGGVVLWVVLCGA